MALTQEQQDLIDLLSQEDYDITAETIEEIDRMAAVWESISPEDLGNPIGVIGCMFGCYPEYFECIRNNPNYPPRAVCDSLLKHCLKNCKTQE